MRAKLENLLNSWRKQLDAGQDVSAQKICAEHGCPELAEHLSREIDVLRGSGCATNEDVGRSTCLWDEKQVDPDAGRQVTGDTSFEEITGRTRAFISDVNKAEEVPDRIAGYTVDGCIGKGGMGAVYRVRDVSLNRDLAIKVMLAVDPDSDSRRRFVEEARICGQLQHPGVVPIHQIGEAEDGRPYFTMKLVEGRTFADILKERQAPLQDLARHVNIFAQICQTVAFAHSRGIIHRDLKPQNIMVGAFGEVQVMDWGLAKTINRTELRDDYVAVEAGTLPSENPSAELTRVGMGLGTPAYAPPEQLRGDVIMVDERADVFGLGAILCQILTGHPPYIGRNTISVISRAERGDLHDAFSRLDASGADVELIQLAKECLAAEPTKRLRDAGAVSARVTQHILGVQDRLRRAELDRVAAETRAIEERKRRNIRLLLALTVSLAVVILGGVGVWWRLQRVARNRAVDADFHSAFAAQQQGKWSEAREALERGQGRLADGGSPLLRQRLNYLQANLSMVSRLEAIRLRRATWTKDGFDDPSASGGYTEAFQEFGLSLDNPDAFSRRIEESPIREQIIAGLDDWLAADAGGEIKLLALLNSVDPHPVRNRVRAAIVRRQRQEIEALAGEIELTEISTDLLGAAAQLIAMKPQAVSLLSRAHLERPADFWVNFYLAQALTKQDPPRPSEAVRYFQAALAIRPNTVAVLNNLGNALADLKEYDAAFRCYHASLKIDPHFEKARFNIGIDLWRMGDLDAVIRAFQENLKWHPRDARTFKALGDVLKAKGDLNGALAQYEQAVKIAPRAHPAFQAIAEAHKARKDFSAAMIAIRKVMQLVPNDARAHANYAQILDRQGDVPGAIKAYREAVSKDPEMAAIRQNLGVLLEKANQPAAALVEYRAAVKLDPNLPESHFSLGEILKKSGNKEEAKSCLRRALELRPSYAEAAVNLGNIFLSDYEFDAAIALYRQAIAAKPTLPNAFGSLGRALYYKGLFAEAREASLKAIELLPPNSPMRERGKRDVLECERALILERKLSAWLRDQRRPDSMAEVVTMAEICCKFKRLPAAALRLYSESFAEDPKRLAKYRGDAAVTALLAATGEGEDCKDLGAEELSKLRQQALDWLRADLARFEELLDGDDPN